MSKVSQSLFKVPPTNLVCQVLEFLWSIQEYGHTSFLHWKVENCYFYFLFTLWLHFFIYPLITFIILDIVKNVKKIILSQNKILWGPWLGQWVGQLTLGFSPGSDLGITLRRESAAPLPLSLPLSPLAHSFSLSNK